MNWFQIIFYFFALVMVVSAIFLAETKNIIYAAFSLLSIFFSVAAIYVYARADFLAITQLIVYIGGILVLLLFGVMLTHKVSGYRVMTQETNKWTGILIAIGIYIVLLSAIIKANFDSITWILEAKNTKQIIDPAQSSVSLIGIKTMTDYLLPFEVIAIVLMVALMGAAYMARRKL